MTKETLQTVTEDALREALVRHLEEGQKIILELLEQNNELLAALTAALIHIEEFDTRPRHTSVSYAEVTNGARQAIAKAGKTNP